MVAFVVVIVGFFFEVFLVGLIGGFVLGFCVGFLLGFFVFVFLPLPCTLPVRRCGPSK